MSAQSIPRLTPEQYLEIERAAEFKSEYFAGRMYAMAGGTIPHAHVIANVIVALAQAVRDRPCIVVSSDARLGVSVEGLYTYPDLMVICGDPKFVDNRRDTVMNPSVIVEVLSKSTEGYDRGFKFAQYRRLESLQEYLLVSQSEPRLKKFRRTAAGEWAFSESVGLDTSCRFESLDCQILLSDVYHKVTFEEEPVR